VVRHHLNPGGNRDANRALHAAALNRLRRDPRAREYVAGRTAEGKSKREAMRCLKRYIARETYRSTVVERLPPKGGGTLSLFSGVRGRGILRSWTSEGSDPPKYLALVPEQPLR
jgi:hypothetical protein